MILYLYIIVIHMVYCPGRLHIAYILSITHVTVINMYSQICAPIFFNHLHTQPTSLHLMWQTINTALSHSHTILKHTNIEIYTLLRGREDQ
jgi:hypothetical protein